MRPLMVDRNLGNSAMALLDVMVDEAEDRAESDAQRRADEQQRLEFLARHWLQHLATAQAVDEHLEPPMSAEAIAVLLDLVRGNVISVADLHALRRRAIEALMPAALEATREPR